MTTKNIIEGITILLRYYDDPNGYHAVAVYEELRMNPTDKPLTCEDVQMMINLKWHQEYDERDYDKDFSVESYRPDEPWVAYV